MKQEQKGSICKSPLLTSMAPAGTCSVLTESAGSGIQGFVPFHKPSTADPDLPSKPRECVCEWCTVGDAAPSSSGCTLHNDSWLDEQWMRAKIQPMILTGLHYWWCCICSQGTVFPLIPTKVTFKQVAGPLYHELQDLSLLKCSPRLNPVSVHKKWHWKCHS